MKKKIQKISSTWVILFAAIFLIACSSSRSNSSSISSASESEVVDNESRVQEPTEPASNEGTESAAEGDESKASDSNGKQSKVLIAYFSWGGTTEKLAQEIQAETGADLFKIEPLNPYPTEYTPTTEVAKEEKENDARPVIKNAVENWDEYDVVFIGCPVWWWTAPMIINTFTESYDFKGKTVIPFVTYASTYRDETLQKIVDLTPESAKHLEGYSNHDSDTVKEWLEKIGQ